MFLKQYYLGCLAHASYMIADEKTKIAAGAYSECNCLRWPGDQVWRLINSPRIRVFAAGIQRGFGSFSRRLGPPG